MNAYTENNGAGNRPLNVVHVSPEVAPFSKTGGLAQVLEELPSELRRLGVNTTVITPAYGAIPDSMSQALPIEIDLQMGNVSHRIGVRQARLKNDVPIYFVTSREAFSRPGIYGPDPDNDYADNAWRFALFTNATIAIMRRLRLHPDIVHCHDWQTGLLPLNLRHQYGGWPPTVMTVHNIGYQGTFDARELTNTGVPKQLFTPDGVEFWGRMSFLKAGLVAAHRVTTVSPTHAEELLSPEYGHGLDGVLRSRADSVSGLLNGIDNTIRNPATDPNIAANYSATDLSGKQQCRRALMKQLGLTSKRPVFGMVSRLVHQKGVDLLLEAVEPLLAQQRACVVVLGTGERTLEARLTQLAERHPQHMAVQIRYDEALASQVVAGCDALLMPSRYEPCGLTQMHALRYGTVPIVRRTGGLADTVRNDDTGFVFERATATALRTALERAINAYEQPEQWQNMQVAAMKENFSWTRSAQTYAKLYESLFDELTRSM